MFFKDIIVLHTLNRLYYNVNITFTCTGKPKKCMTSFLVTFAFLQQCGTEASMLLRSAHRGGAHRP